MLPYSLLIGVVLTRDDVSQRLDFWIDPEYRPRHVKTLVELCKNSGLYPDCLILKGIEFEGDPVVGGGFGDVYKGRLRGQDIAIKVPKTFRQTDVDKLHRVMFYVCSFWRHMLTKLPAIRVRGCYMAAA